MVFRTVVAVRVEDILERVLLRMNIYCASFVEIIDIIIILHVPCARRGIVLGTVNYFLETALYFRIGVEYLLVNALRISGVLEYLGAYEIYSPPHRLFVVFIPEC